MVFEVNETNLSGESNYQEALSIRFQFWYLNVRISMEILKI